MVYLLTMRNVIGVGLLTLCLAQIFILFMVAQFSSSSLASKNDLITLDNNQGATHRKLESGLYRKSTQVLELRSLKEYKDLTDQTNPQIIVHYASWCGHCIHFVPLFEKFAMKVAMATAIARLRDSQVQNITFAAVNCPEQKEICDKNKIDGYPTVCVLHVGSNGGSCQKFVGSTAGVEKLLRKTIFQNGELDGREDMLLSSGNKTKNEVQLAMDRQPRAEDRINDIWITFVHFLLKETPTQLTRNQTRLVHRYVLTLKMLFGSSTSNLRRQTQAKEHSKRVQLLTELDIVVKKYSHHETLPSAKLSSTVTGLYSRTKFDWKVCGKSHPGQVISSSSSSNRNEHRQLSWWSWHQDRSSEDNNSAAVMDIDPSGFSCGLWMLFHLLTVHAEKIMVLSRRFQKDKQSLFAGVQDIVLMMQSFVGDLFRCYSCREHFLRAMNACYFDGCHLTGTNYTGLQTWLLRMHNLVTSRIALEDKVGTNITVSITELEDTLARTIWPSRVVCPQCYHLPDYQQSIQHYQLKHTRRRNRGVLQANNSSYIWASSNSEISFTSLAELETFLRHAIERVFSVEAVVTFLKQAYKL